MSPRETPPNKDSDSFEGPQVVNKTLLQTLRVASSNNSTIRDKLLSLNKGLDIGETPRKNTIAKNLSDLSQKNDVVSSELTPGNATTENIGVRISSQSSLADSDMNQSGEESTDDKYMGLTNGNLESYTTSGLARPRVFQRVKSTIGTSIINPKSRWKEIWDNLVLLMVVFSSIVVPLLVGFQAVKSSRRDLEKVNYSMYMCDVIFAVDIVLTFRCGYIGKQGMVHMDSDHIVKQYLSGWFFVDFISTFPFEIFSLIEGINASKNLWTFMKLPRLLRMVRLLKKFNKVKGGHTMRIFSLLLFFLMMAHWLCCAWFGIGISQTNKENTWVFGQSITENSSMSWTYVTSFYWALTTMTTVGYGDIAPVSTAERWYTIFVFLVGSIMYSSIFANVSILLQNLDSLGNRYRSRMDAINELMRFYQVDADVATRVLKNVERNFTLVGGFDPHQQMEHLPRALRVEVCMHLYEGIVRKAPMFKEVHRSLIQEIVTRLVPSAYDPGDWIFHEGDVGHEMIFIGSGTVAVLGGENEDVTLAKLSTGSFLGETALFFTPSRRTASVRAISQAELYSISKQDFEEVLMDFPQELAEMIAIAEAQRNKNMSIKHHLVHPSFKDLRETLGTTDQEEDNDEASSPRSSTKDREDSKTVKSPPSRKSVESVAVSFRDLQGTGDELSSTGVSLTVERKESMSASLNDDLQWDTRPTGGGIHFGKRTNDNSEPYFDPTNDTPKSTQSSRPARKSAYEPRRTLSATFAGGGRVVNTRLTRSRSLKKSSSADLQELADMAGRMGSAELITTQQAPLQMKYHHPSELLAMQTAVFPQGAPTPNRRRSFEVLNSSTSDFRTRGNSASYLDSVDNDSTLQQVVSEINTLKSVVAALDERSVKMMALLTNVNHQLTSLAQDRRKSITRGR